MRLLVVGCVVSSAVGWQKWTYTSNATQEWRDLWRLQRGPGARRGHSMVLFNTMILMFGGRSNEVRRNHVPKTYEIEDVNGTIEFVSYDRNPIIDGTCFLTNASIPSAWSNDAQNESQYVCENQIDVGLYFNDVWAYELNCTRYADTPCADSTWHTLNVGAHRGGCRYVLGREICTHPSERWLHGAAMFRDSTMLVYGGFSQRCEDYCDDLWSFDVRDGSWMEIYEVGHFADGESPGKRWKFSIVFDGTTFYIFGGFRLWHGFAADNSEDNRWDSYDLLPQGGYLSDLWVYEKRLLAPEEPMPTSSAGLGVWTNLTRKLTCEVTPGTVWDEREDKDCTVTWPTARAGHVAALDGELGGMWVFGGYTTFFPYLTTDGPGSGPGVVSKPSSVGFIPYPNYPYYLDDLWFYNLTSGFWTLIQPVSAYNPAPRTDHAIVLDGRILIMFGGFNGSHHFDDTWYFNTTATSMRWLQKKSVVYPLWPKMCTDDMEDVAVRADECFLLEWKRPVRAMCGSPSRDGCRYNDWYAPDPNNSALNFGKYNGAPFYGIVGRYDDAPTEVAEGQPIAPEAATGPRQWVSGAQWWNDTWLASREAAGDVGDYFVSSETDANETSYSGTFYRRCTSVQGEVTRGGSIGWTGGTVDGVAGRASEPISIPQPRRRAPGWDGCRDQCFGVTNADLRSDDANNFACPEDAALLPDVGLQYLHPNQRSDHAVIHAPGLGQTPTESRNLGEVYIFGGVGYDSERYQTTNTTFETTVLSDMWRLGIHDCPYNCSDQGDCVYGFCRCYPGYYGRDCSNVSCPGDFCFIDEDTNVQICQHCCQAGYNHTDDDAYEIDVPRVPCGFDSRREDLSFGESNGICDGFGTCQCAPPYILDDCSVKDCKHNCSARGHCSVEFPVSRCICNPGYYGEYCQFRICLNNCSYPNGHCDPITGSCTCEMMYSPYQAGEREYHAWEGEDCSYLWAYCAGTATTASWALLLLALLLPHNLD